MTSKSELQAIEGNNFSELITIKFTCTTMELHIQIALRLLFTLNKWPQTAGLLFT